MRKPGAGPSTSTSRKSPEGRSAAERIQPAAGETGKPGSAASTYAVSAEKPSSRSRAKTARASADATQSERGCRRNGPRQKLRPLERLRRKRQVVVDLELIADAEERRVRGEESLAPDPARGPDVARVVNRSGLVGIVEKETRWRRVAGGLWQPREARRPLRQHGRVLDRREATRHFFPVQENGEGEKRQDDRQTARRDGQGEPGEP